MTGHGLETAVEVATAVRAMQLGDIPDGDLSSVVVANTERPGRALVRQAILSRLLVEACEARVDALLASPEALLGALMAVQRGRPVRAAQIGVQFDRVLATQGQALASTSTR
jgi:hypothetical protein